MELAERDEQELDETLPLEPDVDGLKVEEKLTAGDKEARWRPSEPPLPTVGE